MSAGLAMLLAIVVTPTRAIAVPVPVFSLQGVVDQSDFVVLGVAISTADVELASIDRADGSRVYGRQKVATIAVEQVLKGGQDLVQADVRYFDTTEFIGYGGVPLDSPSIYFPKSRNGQYEFTSPYYPSIVGAAGARISSGNPIDRVLEALGAVLADRQRDIMAKRSALHAMDRVNRPLARTLLRSAMSGADRDLRLVALCGLLAIDDLDALRAAEPYLLEADVDPTHSSPFVWMQPSQDVENLVYAVSEIRSEGAAPVFERLLRARGTEVRRRVASALRQMRSPATLPLLRIALDDSDWKVRRSAMLTLSEVTRAPGCAGSYDRNDEQEAPCLQFWKDWFARRP